MNRTAFAALALAALVAGPVSAQTVVIEPEQETVIREYVTTHQVEPVTISDVEITVGATLPATVELYPVEVPEVTYSYVVVDDRTLIVEPETRKIVQILD